MSAQVTRILSVDFETVKGNAESDDNSSTEDLEWHWRISDFHSDLVFFESMLGDPAAAAQLRDAAIKWLIILILIILIIIIILILFYNNNMNIIN